MTIRSSTATISLNVAEAGLTSRAVVDSPWLSKGLKSPTKPDIQLHIRSTKQSMALTISRRR
jgi:hypothetical protein